VAVFLSLAGPRNASAVVLDGAASGQTTSTGAGGGWNYVGTVNGASGVYLGDYGGSYWVLTASHVGSGTFILNSGTYSAVASSTVRITNTDGSNADLVVYKISGSAALDLLPNLTFSSINAGAQVTMIGYGTDIQTTLTKWTTSGTGSNMVWTETTGTFNYSGFKYDTTHTKRWGVNTVDGATAGNAGYGTTQLIYSDFDNLSGQAQATAGDSGGGVFTASGALAGIMLYVNPPINTANQPANTVAYGDITYFANMSYYSSRILAVIPEPPVGGMLCMGMIILVLLLRRRAG